MVTAGSSSSSTTQGGGGGGGGGATNNTNNKITNLPPAANAKEDCEMRYSQLVEEQEHKFSTTTNQKELLTQKLHRLRLLKDEIARDDWMFESFGK